METPTTEKVNQPTMKTGEKQQPASKPSAQSSQKRSFFSGRKPESAPKPTAILKPMPDDADLVESYWVKEPHAKVNIISSPDLGGAHAYYIEESQLSTVEKTAFEKLLDILGKELEPPKTTDQDATGYVVQEAKRIALKYRRSLGKFDETAWAKVLYYIERDLIGSGHVYVPMHDPLIEDISSNGVGLPLYVWHRKYESMPTNLVVLEKRALDNLIVKLAHLSGKHISTAFPVLDAMLPGQHRLATTFKEEVSPKGSTFTIRKFREEPFSIVDLMNLGTINENLAAYFWMLLENRVTVVVIGGTGAGKTSTLNALASLVKPAMKIVTVEEIPELHLPHENWVQLVSRESYGLGAVKTGEITLFQLVKTALRYRPDYLVVGEVRGEEAFVLFQAMATGHGGMCTLHAENMDYAIKRLTSPPMNVSQTYIPLMNVAAIVERTQLPKRAGGPTFGRRIRNVSEVEDFGVYHKVEEWNPVDDVLQTDLKESYMLQRIADRWGKSFAAITEEVERRARVLAWMQKQGVSSNDEVARVIAQYYVKPTAFEKMVMEDLHANRVLDSQIKSEVN